LVRISCKFNIKCEVKSDRVLWTDLHGNPLTTSRVSTNVSLHVKHFLDCISAPSSNSSLVSLVSRSSFLRISFSQSLAFPFNLVRLDSD
jgi:hypothetical protein